MHSDSLQSSDILEEIDFKVHYDYHSSDRCTPFSAVFDVLKCIEFGDFCQVIQDHVPYLRRLTSVRITYKDEEGHWVDVDERNYSKFIKTGKLINIRVVDGQSPCPAQKQLPTRSDSDSRGMSKRQLFQTQPRVSTATATERNESTSFLYKSPLEIDIDLKENELCAKEMELREYKRKYESLDAEYNPRVPRGTGKLCHKCHTREGHTRTKCTNVPCTSVLICGEVDVHPDSKKELTELAGLKNKIEGEVKKLKSEVEVKQRVKTQMLTTFENKIHDDLIRSNPNKYLIDGGPAYKKRILDADKAILRKYYKAKAPDNLEIASVTWQAIIDAETEKWSTGQRKPIQPRNPVLEMMKAMTSQNQQPSSTATMSAPGQDSSLSLLPGIGLAISPSIHQGIPTHQGSGQPFYHDYHGMYYPYGMPSYGGPMFTGSFPAASISSPNPPLPANPMYPLLPANPMNPPLPANPHPECTPRKPPPPPPSS
jgi:hypothetical protein